MGPKKALPALNMAEYAPQNPHMQQSYHVTASGTFNKDDFSVKSTGISATPEGQGRVSSLAMADLTVDETPVGSGASGFVRKALHVPTQRVIALKSINVSDKSKRDQLMTELKILTKAESPHVLEFYDAFWADPYIHLAIEYMDRGSLDVVMKQCEIPSEEVISLIMRQLLLGLHFLHDVRKNIHRDLKPGNILVASNGCVKVSDFGISREMNQTKGFAATFTGTAIYMSPERMQGKPYSFPADVWALGLIATELSLGRYPYHLRPDMKYFELVTTIANRPPPLPGADFSADFNAFVGETIQPLEVNRSDCAKLLMHTFIQKYSAQTEAIVSTWLETKKIQMI
mmetsp:Transcript_35068/g.68737  ORF Transcript_35068/g.68737 Transcript_35068/m.68737 type:complete len:343 (+) Transcript_35068:129-1157(+)|eukprot:CAMPEP_0173389992 /NCGR_PEP_ID=MMETSP1356-20130122/14232_1 /TAXON_ID=77927 ORGANISM="Hemiselmis virescens, Strain PCC157" /NCGR_SAMPLE_ID=MMETSP1356 /ASSEMBLY_ACC=CAM_ASM_000847 /LENGTH=342 /DNA_ID=CAMNT_0014347295 /DNA_START=109 /DNA_END=1137 /DNA_ORIENTATION=-